MPVATASVVFRAVVAVAVSAAIHGCDWVTSGSFRSPKFVTYANQNLEIIPGEYLVTFDSAIVPEIAVPGLARLLVAPTSGRIDYVFTQGFRGFAATGLNDAWAIAASGLPEVAMVRKNFRVYGQEIRGSVFGPVPWSLDRIDQRAPLSLDRDYRYKTGPVAPGQPIPIYVLDNGIYLDHAEFSSNNMSRVENVADVTNGNFVRCAGPFADANHGTAVASIAAGNTLGISPAPLKNVKVLDKGIIGCTAGSPTAVSKGLEEVLKHMRRHFVPRAVVNLSVGWPSSQAAPDVETLVRSLQVEGAVIVAAAGNENRDASGFAPANLPGVVAVGATTDSGSRVVVDADNGSNFGSTVAIWAPGDRVVVADWPSAGFTNPSARTLAGGTSIAAPHVAGAIALLLQQDPGLKANQVVSELRSRATRFMLTDLGAGSNNHLLYVGETGPQPGAVFRISSAGSSGNFEAVRMSIFGTRVFVAGTAPQMTIAAFDASNLAGGALWTKTSASSTDTKECTDIHVTGEPIGPSSDIFPIYFGCMGWRNGAREAVIVALQQDGARAWAQSAWLGSGSTMRGIAGGVVHSPLGPRHLVFAATSRPTPNGTEAVVTSIDAATGQSLVSNVLSATGFNEQFHAPVDLVLVDSSPNATDLVVASYSDPPGNDKTFLWRLDPQLLQVAAWREVPVPMPAEKGIFPTALAVQPREDNLHGVIVAGEVYLAAQAVVKDGARTVPWAYIYRLDASRVNGTPIDVVKDAFVWSLWSDEGDLYFGGNTSRSFPPGDVVGVPRPGASPRFDAFLGKSEGVVGGRRWMTTFNTGQVSNLGSVGYGAAKGYLAGSDGDDLVLIKFQIY